MKYDGFELKEFTSDKPVVFDPPRRMAVWDDDDKICRQAVVLAYLPESTSPVIVDCSFWQHCAEIPGIPEEPKPRRATNRELAKWLAQGNGMCKRRGGVTFHTCIRCGMDETDTECDSTFIIQKWDDTEWHEPTIDYLGLEE
nr:MAG TPA: hypothetical protein [Caudoviricetes sp.]